MSSNRNRKRNNRKKNGKNNNRRNGKPPAPRVGVFKSITQKPVMTRTIRYQYTEATQTQTISNIDLLNMLLFVNAASSTAYRLFESVRLMRVGITGLANSATGVATVGFEWQGQNSPVTMSEQILNSNQPCHQNYYPPANSSCSWWWSRPNTTALDVFRLSYVYVTSAPVVFVDLEIQYVLDDGDCFNTTLSGAPGITGIVYPSIPIGGSSGGDLVPVGLSTVT